MIESEKIKHRLNLINKVRARGVGEHIALPQLVVCGDQSAGKSSVLEGITGIPFPRKDGLCTKFATEIVLRHTDCEDSITASITPHVSRDEATADNLRKYSRSLSGYDELPEVIEEVGKLLGLKGFSDGDDDAPTFAADVLRVEVIGQTGLDLTVVDLPGLIAASEDENNIAFVKNLVDSYLESSRTIILAVIPAPSDIETQGIIQRTRHFDKEGERTVGILTKPDLINKKGHGKVLQLLRNEGPLKLKLGFFLLRNPDPDDLEQGITAEGRKKKELDFFFKDPKWSGLSPDPARIGIDAIRTFLESLLEEHIERELPKVHAEISRLLEDTKGLLGQLGEERGTVALQRGFLSELSVDYLAIVQAAMIGTYQSANPKFFSEEKNGLFHNRLRAHVHSLNKKFSDYMRERSRKRQIQHEVGSRGTKDDGHFATLQEPMEVTDEEFNEWVMKVYRNTRGLELSGNCNYTLLMELFQEQSSRWEEIARKHTMTLHQVVSDFVERALEEVVKEERVRTELRPIIRQSLQANLESAMDELRNILGDEKLQPLTYNHYYTDNVQKSRQDELKEVVKKALESTLEDNAGNLHVSNVASDQSMLLHLLQSHVNVDMDKKACEEASTDLIAYYKVWSNPTNLLNTQSL